jgi:hypothetical protein
VITYGSWLAWGGRMPDDLHQRILALLFARPDLALALWRAAEPGIAEVLDRGWIVIIRDANLRVRTFGTKDRHLIADMIITLHPADDPGSDPAIVLVIECQLNTDPTKLYSWVEYLAAARRTYEAVGRVMVLSPVDDIISWAHGLFDDEPWLRPTLIGRDVVPIIDDHGRALRDPELAVLSAVFHGASERGFEVLSAAGLALQTLPRRKRQEYVMLLEDALPEEMMVEIRKVTEEEARKAAEKWFRSRAPYQIGHREGLEQGLEQGRRDALALVLELRGLTPTSLEQSRIDHCHDPEQLERWCQRAKTATSVAELLDMLDMD